MKKFLLAIVILITATLVNAQSGTSFSIGFEVAGSMGKFNDFGYRYGFGGSAQAIHKVASDLAVTLHTGYINHANKRTITNTHFSVVPILAGIKYWISPKIYGSGQLGVALNNTKISNSSSGGTSSIAFAYSPGIGFNITSGIDLLVKFFGNGAGDGALSTIGGRLAYNFGK